MTLDPEKLLSLIGKMLNEREKRIRESLEKEIQIKTLDSELRFEEARSKLYEAVDTLADPQDLVSDLEFYKSEFERMSRELYEKVEAGRVEHCGPYEEGKQYRQNNIVVRDGSTYICAKNETNADPRLKTGGWRLLAMRGEKGHTGKEGPKGSKGAPGTPGKQGEKGKDGREIAEIKAEGARLIFVMSDGEVFSINLKKELEALNADAD